LPKSTPRGSDRRHEATDHLRHPRRGRPPAIAGATDLTLGHNVRTREEVDTVMQQATRAGATIVKAAGPTFWGGYAGYFQDPDGHLWEIAWNPQALPAD
jgi:uncharacterized glyoxalase superfamily protein PhnB